MLRDTLKKALPITEDEYIVSYISLTHKYHSLLAISKKVKDNYYLVNTIGLQQVNDSIAHREYANADIRAIFEVIHPTKSLIPLQAKHYSITNATANRILDFMNHKRGQALLFNEFSHNCHNFALAILENNGIHDKKLYSYSLPAKLNKNLCSLAIVDVPETLISSEAKNSYMFIDKSNIHSSATTIKNQEGLKTWKWNTPIKIKSTISYQPKKAYLKLIANAPTITTTNKSMSQINLNKAIFLLKNYAQGSFFWHPCRNYRTLINNCLQEFEKKKDKTIDSLLVCVREAIDQYHKKEGDVAYVKGSLHRRLAFINFVLNTNVGSVELTTDKKKLITQ